MHETERPDDRLHAELVALRQRVAELEAAAAGSQQREATLVDAAAQWRVLAEQSGEGLLIHRDGTPLFVNQAYAAVFGYDSPDDVLCAPDLMRRVTAPHAQTRRRQHENAPTRHVSQCRRKDGTLVWVEQVVRAITWEGAAAIQCTVREITDQMQREEALRHSEVRYRQLVDKSLGFICTHDLNGLALSVNPAAAKALGSRPEDIVGHSLQTLLAPAFQSHFDAYLVRIREQRTDHGVIRVVTRTGEERLWQYHNALVEEPGHPPYVVGHAQDITDFRQTQEALQRSEARYRLLAENVTDVIWVRDLEFRPVYISPSVTRLRGYSVEEVMQESLEEALTPHSYAVATEALAQFWHREHSGERVEATPAALTLEATRKDGSTVWVETQITVMRDAAGHPTGFLGVNRDITVRKQVEDALRKAQTTLEQRVAERTAALAHANAALHAEIAERKKAEAERRELEMQLHHAQKMEAIGTLAGGIAHDFNNILSAIIGFTELAVFDLPSGSAAGQHLHEVLTASHRGKDLIQHILLFSRQTEPGRHPVHIHQLVHDVLRLLRASIPATIDIQQHVAADTGMILADPTQMHQVLMNLCVNAEQAMRETGGHLEVRVEPMEITHAGVALQLALSPGSYVRFTIRDTGSGISADVRERIFEPFYTTKPIGEGTGMGLAMVHGIVTHLGGTITVESTPGEGSIFTLYLPRIAAQEPESLEVDTELPHGTERLMFVDDEPALTHSMSTLLERLGYRVLGCTSGREVLDAFRADPQRFDLVITDQTMPQMTGDRLAQALRRIRPDMPIILCTGFSHGMNTEKAYEMGLDAYLTKPVVLRELAQTIRHVFAQRSPESSD